MWPVSETCVSWAFNVAQVMYTWARFAHVGDEKPFLSGNKDLTISRDVLTTEMKRTTTNLNLDATRFTLRSLRYGGAN